MTESTSSGEIAPGTTLALVQRLDNNALIDEECRILTGATPIDGIAWNARPERVADGAYVTLALEVMASGQDIHSLCANTAAFTEHLDLEGFHIKFINQSGRRLNRGELIVRLANAIPDYPDLTEPAHRLALLVTPEVWLLGRILNRTRRDHLVHQERPHRTSSSLPVQLAGAMVNLLAGSAQQILDPCCGSGTLPLAAAARGYSVSCGDVNWRMVKMTNGNLEHFGFPSTAVTRDCREWQGEFDAVITDLPYGIFNHVSNDDPEILQDMLSHFPSLAPLAIIVAAGDLREQLANAGYARIDAYEVVKNRGLSRFVHRAYR